MKTVVLAKSDIEFLRENSIITSELYEKAKIVYRYRNDLGRNEDADRRELHLSNKQIDQVLDNLSDLLISRGVDNGAEPNSLGVYVERLIDVFNQEL